jgi:NAD-dependent dihydropyrimidine dehydrogenase PreA subunit
LAYVIAAPCIADYSCLRSCPVECISPAPQEGGFDTGEQLYINPATCISRGACKDVCPVEAIYERSELPAQWSPADRRFVVSRPAPGGDRETGHVRFIEGIR